MRGAPVPRGSYPHAPGRAPGYRAVSRGSLKCCRPPKEVPVRWPKDSRAAIRRCSRSRSRWRPPDTPPHTPGHPVAQPVVAHVAFADHAARRGCIAARHKSSSTCSTGSRCKLRRYASLRPWRGPWYRPSPDSRSGTTAPRSGCSPSTDSGAASADSSRLPPRPHAASSARQDCRSVRCRRPHSICSQCTSSYRSGIGTVRLLEGVATESARAAKFRFERGPGLPV